MGYTSTRQGPARLLIVSALLGVAALSPWIAGGESPVVLVVSADASVPPPAPDLIAMDDSAGPPVTARTERVDEDRVELVVETRTQVVQPAANPDPELLERIAEVTRGGPPDRDGDGISDAVELFELGTDPTVPN